ncbi:MAG: dicarboxylate/amino acid:cation symporter [Endozoicomonas sp. (ex Botrylloides leachii)]|nr:dicarboxylate/amino acid:cation symporter [Endozoicomonas sp. (ex Botrylloides leachii)]
MIKIWKEFSLTSKVLTGMIAGLLTGLLLRSAFGGIAFVDEYITNGLFYVIGQIFISSLKMLVVPLIFTSIICGTCSLTDASTLGRLSVKTLGLYLFTTAIAISLAIIAAVLFEPGVGANLTTTTEFNVNEAPPLSRILVQLFPANPIGALAQGDTLQIIVFAVFVGISISAAGVKGERTAKLFQSLNEVMMKLVALIMNIAPYGIFCLIAKLFSTIELSAIASLLKYFLVLVGALIFHVCVTYFSLLKAFSGLSPITFIRKMEDAIMFAFSTASSNATIPVTMETATMRLGVSNRIASFTIPLGSTVNMDGTAIMQGVATVFIAQAFSIHLGLSDYITVILTATLASIGTAGVPGVGLVMLSMVLQQVGLPVEGIALIVGVDRLLDMVRTAVNITGDSVVTCIVAKSEGDLDIDAFNNPNAGVEEETIDLQRVYQK